MKIRKNLLFFIAVTGLLIAATHALAVFFFLYWEWRWLDIPMHFLGGAFVGFLFLWVYFTFSESNKFSKKHILFTSIIPAFVISIVWELFEYFMGVSFIFFDFWFDTTLDTIFGILGAWVVGFYVFKYFEKNEEAE